MPINSALAALFNDLLLLIRWRFMRAIARSGRTIVQPIVALVFVAREPLVSGTQADTHRLCSFAGAQTIFKDTSDQKGSTMDS